VAGDGGAVNGAHRLILLRHAKSDWPSAIADHDRPLAKRGRRDAPLVGRWLARSGYVPDAVVCSTARRTRETWELVAAELGTAPVVSYEPRVYEATVLRLLMLVREFAEEHRTVLLIGHNPGMAELTAGLPELPPPPPLSFPTATAAVMSIPGQWADIAPGEATLLAFATPTGMRS
jgi:phosphohistidine phosphatase